MLNPMQSIYDVGANFNTFSNVNSYPSADLGMTSRRSLV
jgi:hypothetical protein